MKKTTTTTEQRCGLDSPDPKAARGHAYRYTDRGNRCRWCNRLSEYQDKLLAAVAVGRA